MVEMRTWPKAMERGRPRRSAAHASAVGMLLLLFAAPAHGQTYTVSVEESGVPYPTSYTKRFNWRYYGDLRHTTGIASSEDPYACAESPCLDDGEPGDQPPDGTRGGIASGSIGGMDPGQYTIEIKCRRSDNRATSVPWIVTTDAASNNQSQGTLDLRNDPAISTDPTGSWFVVGDTGESPISVQGSLAFSFGANSGLDGSLSYGGLRATRVCPLAGVCSPGDVQPCGACGGSQTCTGACQWGPCEESCPDGALPPPDAATGGDAAPGGDGALPGEDGGGSGFEGRLLQGGCGCGLAGRAAHDLPALLVLAVLLVVRANRRARRAPRCGHQPRRSSLTILPSAPTTRTASGIVPGSACVAQARHGS